MNICYSCGIPVDAGFFDESAITDAPELGEEVVLVRYELHRNYCGMLLYFAQFTDRYASDPTEVQTPGYQWQIRCNGQPRDPYLTFDRIINPLDAPAAEFRYSTFNASGSVHRFCSSCRRFLFKSQVTVGDLYGDRNLRCLFRHPKDVCPIIKRKHIVGKPAGDDRFEVFELH